MPMKKPTPQQALVIFAKSKKRMSAFYQRTLGLLAVEQAPSHDLLQGHGIELVIHAIPRKYAAENQDHEATASQRRNSIQACILCPRP